MGAVPELIAQLDITELPEGEILRTLEPLSPAERAFLETWETPFTQWGAFKVSSDIHLESAPSGRRLRFARTRSGALDSPATARRITSWNWARCRRIRHRQRSTVRSMRK